ncbi:response regulator [Candidatus Uabimicrobium amorphum]|uniref:DNA-binding response regulator n=1 Tax=Uabimicrobium amorphum TaxID=2596890 RepID=A0A5S9IQX5_UABAM|nr:response regulator [Candidatus Uabimicrobium amorphum]BBM85941.1 DNA-binding response regulator [Candidatus Uabimicrobium amorphum]
MSPLSIMTVDDDPIIRLALKKILERDGCVVVEARDGQEALDKIREEKPNLVILDVNMPRMTGWQLIRMLRANPMFSLIPVIFLSVENDPKDELQGFRLGADAYISKPFSPKKLIATTIEVLKKSRAFREKFENTGMYNTPARQNNIVDEYIADSDEFMSIDEFEVDNTEEPAYEEDDLVLIDNFEESETESKMPVVHTILSGSLMQIGLSSVLSMINLERKTGILILDNVDKTEKVQAYVVKGEIFKAESEGVDFVNEEAIYNALTWQGGKFAFYYQDVDIEDEIDAPITSILLEGARLIDEALRDNS